VLFLSEVKKKKITIFRNMLFLYTKQIVNNQNTIIDISNTTITTKLIIIGDDEGSVRGGGGGGVEEEKEKIRTKSTRYL
jgi:hypothetical protein